MGLACNRNHLIPPVHMGGHDLESTYQVPWNMAHVHILSPPCTVSWVPINAAWLLFPSVLSFIYLVVCTILMDHISEPRWFLFCGCLTAQEVWETSTAVGLLCYGISSASAGFYAFNYISLTWRKTEEVFFWKNSLNSYLFFRHAYITYFKIAVTKLVFNAEVNTYSTFMLLSKTPEFIMNY